MKREHPEGADIEAAAVRFAVELLTASGEMQTGHLVRKVLERVRATFDGAPPPTPCRRNLTKAAICGAIGSVFVEEVRRTSDGRYQDGGYRAFLSLALQESAT